MRIVTAIRVALLAASIAAPLALRAEEPSVKEGIDEVGRAIADDSKKGWDATKDFTKEGWEATKNVTKKGTGTALEKTGEGLDKAGNAVEGAGSDVKK